MNVPYPKISGSSSQQLEQIRGYLYQLVEQLNMEGSTQAVSNSSGQPFSHGIAMKDPITQGGLVSDNEGATSTPMGNFNQIKSLIIKSAEIVDAYYTEINRRLEGVYVAESDFGKYQNETSQTIKESADRIDRLFEDMQSITGQMEQEVIAIANIRTGKLFTVGNENLEPELGQVLADGTPVYGVEVGQTVHDGEQEIFNKFARFTAYGITLYDRNGNLSAYITDNKMNIPNASINRSLTRGGFAETINADGSSVERWVGV